MKPPFLRSEYNYDMSKASTETGLECKDKTRTQQHLAEETNINWIVNRYQQTGEVPQHQLPPLNIDFAQGLDFQQAMDQIVQAREAFDALPSGVRSKFHNDPAEFVDFMSNADNRDQIRGMGLWNDDAMKQWDDAQKAAKATQAALEADAAAYRATKGDTKKGVT